MNHHPRRACSPPFGYDPRAMDGRHGYEDPYNLAHQYEGPPQPLAPAGPPPYIDHGYPINYREQPTNLQPPYRASIGQRDQFPVVGPTSPPPPPNQQRAASPLYKILCITNINPKIGDNTVKEALTSEYSRFGVASVSVCHDNGERLAYIYFQNYEEAREARYAKARTLFFDRPVDIEPIYDPRAELNGSPLDNSPPMASSMPSLYQTRRRSITPEYQDDMNNPASHRRQPMPYLQHQQVQPAPMHHLRGVSPVDYPSSITSHAAQYPYGPSPTPMGPAPITHDRRSAHGLAYVQPQPGLHPHSPYASPPHESFRTSYPPPHHTSSHHQFDQASTPPYGDPYGGSHHHQYARSDRDRVPSEAAYIRSRSPRTDMYYQQRGIFAPASISSHHYPPSRSAHSSTSHYPSNSELSPSVHQQSSSTSKYRSSPPPAPQHYRNHRPDPPARFLSREFRREKFGSEHYNTEHDDGRPSRVLLVNNVDSEKTVGDLKDTFRPFGIVEEMEVKEVAPTISSALIKFSSMDGAYKAKTAIDGRYIGNSRCRIVYGKVSASRRLWIGGLNPSTTVSGLEDECSKYGVLTNIEYTSSRPYAYVEYETANQAQFAAHHMKSTLTPANERKIRIEFVDPERSEKLLPSNETNSQISDAGSKSRVSNESWTANDTNTHMTGSRKRSSTPVEPVSTKKPCQPDDLPIVANTFKQERLAAAAAAKARASSFTASEGTTPRYNLETSSPAGVRKDEKTELNNNGKDNSQTGFSNPIRDHMTEDGVKDTPGKDELNECTCIHHIVNHCSVSWPSQITLRNFTFSVRIFLCSGRKKLIDRYFTTLNNASENGRDQYPILHITQRWRLHPQPKLEEVKKRMQSENSGYLIITARQINDDSRPSVSHDDKTAPQKSEKGFDDGGSLQSGEQFSKPIDQHASNNSRTCENTKTNSRENSIRVDSETDTNHGQNHTTSTNQATQSRPLRNLISYLEQKDAAGVISLGTFDGAGATDQTSVSNEGSSKLLYVFPPCDFAMNLIKRKVPNLTVESLNEEFLLGVIVGSNETKI